MAAGKDGQDMASCLNLYSASGVGSLGRWQTSRSFELLRSTHWRLNGAGLAESADASAFCITKGLCTGDDVGTDEP